MDRCLGTETACCHCPLLRNSICPRERSHIMPCAIIPMNQRCFQDCGQMQQLISFGTGWLAETVSGPTGEACIYCSIREPGTAVWSSRLKAGICMPCTHHCLRQNHDPRRPDVPARSRRRGQDACSPHLQFLFKQSVLHLDAQSVMPLKLFSGSHPALAAALLDKRLSEQKHRTRI